MATSSITKTFYVVDQEAYKRLLKELNENTAPAKPFKSEALEYGRSKLATFVFAEEDNSAKICKRNQLPLDKKQTLCYYTYGTSDRYVFSTW